MNLGNLTEDQRRQLNELLSASSIGSMGGQGYLNGQQNGRLSDLMNPQPQQPMMPDGMPENYIQRGNNPPIPIQPAPRSMGPALDYSSAPVDFGGMKGYRVKGDPMSIVMADGRIVRTGEDTGAAMKRQMQALELQKKMMEVKNEGRPYYQFLPTEKGIAIGDTRAGTLKLGEIGGVPGSTIMRASDSPELQGRIAGSKQQAETDVKTKSEVGKAVNTGNQFLSSAQTANELLGQNVTQSGVGAIADKVAGFFGASPESSQNASKLEALSGWMVSNVPRMEGPQSNFDVDNYKIMAGKVGDRTIPTAERKAALATVIGLQEKYKHLNQGRIDALQGAQGAPKLKAGTVEDGHVFLGGDPANPASWKKVK